MTSLWLSRQKSERDSQQYSVILDNTERRNSEIVHVSPYGNDIYTPKPLKTKKEAEKVKFKRPESTKCQHPSDVMVRDVTLTELK